MTKISCGNEPINSLLEGGIEPGIVTTIYGPAGAGKTCACILAAIEVIKRGKKVIFIDTEGGFSVDRVAQITDQHEDILKQMVFFQPATFHEQSKVFEQLTPQVTKTAGLIIVDTIGMLYRVERARDPQNITELNNQLSSQVSYLSNIARKNNIPVLLTNQVYADFQKKNHIKIVGGDILKYGSKCLIEITIPQPKERKATLIKHRSITEKKEVAFKITGKGFVNVDTKN